jgi:excisionase family DNA binding protein
MDGDRLLTPIQTREVLGVCASTVRRWADSGLLASTRTPGGERRFVAADVEHLRAALDRPAVEPPPRTPHPPIGRGRNRPTLSASQVAALVDVDPRTIRRWARSGVLPATRTAGGQYRWNREDVDRLIAEHGLRAGTAG